MLAEVELAGRPRVSAVLALGLAALGARGRRPVVVLAGLGTLLLVDAALGGGLAADLLTPLAAVAWAAFGVGAAARTRTTVGAAGITVGLLTLADQLVSSSRFAWWNDIAFYVIVVGGPAVLGALLAARSRQISELRARSQALEAAGDLPARLARAVEAERLERSVDSVLAARISGIIVDAEYADRLCTAAPARALGAVERVEFAAREVLQDLRDVLGALHPQPLPMIGPAVTAVRVGDETAPGRQPPPARGWADLMLAAAALPVLLEVLVTPGMRGSLAANVAACVLLSVLLGTARRRPLLAAGALVVLTQVFGMWLTPAAGTVTWLAPLLVLAYLLGAKEPLLRAVVGLLVLSGGTMVVEGASGDLQGLAPTLVLTALAWTGGRFVRDRELLAVRQRELGVALEQGRQQRAQLAIAEQRARTARELHDIGAHAMTVVCLQAGAARRVWEVDPVAAREALRTVACVSRDTLAHLRDAFAVISHGSNGGGPALGELEPLVGLGRSLGLQIQVKVEGALRPVPTPVSIVAYRVVQEALTNAARYAAHSRVQVSVLYLDDELIVQVQDEGAYGTDELPVALPGSGLGLQGMRERVEACSGRLTYGRRPTGGFAVNARLPLGAAELRTST